MKSKFQICFAVATVCVLLPLLTHAQDPSTDSVATNIKGLQATLDQVFQTMLTKCGELTGVGRGLAGFGALWYIAYRAWGHLARAEEIDFFPLLRPFAIGVALIVYPSIVGLINGVMQPTVDATGALVSNSNQAIGTLLAQKKALVQQGQEWQMYVGPDGNGSMDKWAQYTGNTDNGIGSGFGLMNWAKFEMSKAAYNIKNSFKVVLSEFLEILFEAAALCVNTARIFYLVVLAIIGPLCLGFSVYDGFHHVFVSWLAKYVHVFLWLPVCNIFGSIIGQVQEEMLKIDINQLQTSGQTYFGATDVAYFVFLCMGIVGYFTVPSITQHIITVFPVGGAHLAKVTNVADQTTNQMMTKSMEASSAGARAGAEAISGIFF